MSFLKLKNRVSSEYETTPTILPVQNAYSPYNRLFNPTTPPTIQETVYKPDQFDRINSYKEKNIGREAVKREAKEFAQTRRKHNIYSRSLCCVCFPCLPMWTRTICCFLFLGIFGFVSLLMFFFLSFKKPQIVFNGGNQHISAQTNQSTMEFQYSIYNGNFFELDFENLRFVTYYPTVNKITMGVGEISDVRLGPQADTNITIPVKVAGESENAFENMVIELCRSNDSSPSQNGTSNQNNNHNDIIITVDIMPTIRFLGNYVISLALKGQKSKVSCDKLLQSTVSNNLIENFKESLSFQNKI